MDEQPLMGMSMRACPGSRIHDTMELLGLDYPEAVGFATATALQFLDDAIPDPPVSPAAPLASAVAERPPADGVDRISRLLDAVLRNVVSRLPAKDAARTAALATRWRGLWRAAPLAVVDAHLIPAFIPAERVMPGGDDISSMVVVLQAFRVLAAHPGPFRCVHITRGRMALHQAEMERWLKLLAAKGVQELVFINSPWPLDFPLPAEIFSCVSVTHLQLGAWMLPDTAALPRSARFPHLKELVLSFMLMREHDIAFLLDRSPALEKLTIIATQIDLRIRLVSRNLRCVQLGMSVLGDVAIVDAPRLERLFI